MLSPDIFNKTNQQFYHYSCSFIIKVSTTAEHLNNNPCIKEKGAALHFLDFNVNYIHNHTQVTSLCTPFPVWNYILSGLFIEHYNCPLKQGGFHAFTLRESYPASHTTKHSSLVGKIQKCISYSSNKLISFSVPVKSWDTPYHTMTNPPHCRHENYDIPLK